MTNIEGEITKYDSILLTGSVINENFLVKATELNGYSKQKRNLYILSYSLNSKHNEFVNSALSARFNLIELYYDLYGSYKIDNGAQLIITELTEIIGHFKSSIVIGHSFSGYIAHQLASIIPQISYCVLIDTRNFFEPEKYKGRYLLKSLFMNLLKQIIKNKDYAYPLYLAKGFFRHLTYIKNDDDERFSKGVDCFLENIKYKPAINNCIFFKVSRSSFRYKNHGFGWKSYVRGNFYLMEFMANHNNIIQKHAITMADYINKTASES